MLPTRQLSTFDLNLLRALDVLLRERSVTRSAMELNVTQQAVSGSLKRLREYFGDPLLVRTRHGLEPTPLAVALAAPVRDALHGIMSALETVPTFVPGATKRRFRMAMPDHCSLTVLPLLVAELARTALCITYEVIPINRQAVYDMDLGNLEFLIISQGHGGQLYLSQSIRTVLLFTDRFVCVVDSRCTDLSLRPMPIGIMSS